MKNLICICCPKGCHLTVDEKKGLRPLRPRILRVFYISSSPARSLKSGRDPTRNKRQKISTQNFFQDY